MALLSAIDISQNANRLTGRPINAQTGTTYTLALTDAGKMVTLSNASSIAVTVPTNASVAFPTGSEVYLAQIGAGAVTVAGDTGVTVNAPDSVLSFDPQHTQAKLVKVGTNTWQFTFLGGGSGSETIDMGACQGRLTLTTGVPVTTSDVTAATTVYFTPYKGNIVSLYTGAAWVYHTLSELSISVPATTNTMYDVWCDYNGGTPQLVLDAWTNDTTRATALTTQDGVYVKTGATDHRYLGSFRTTGVSGQTEDSVARRLVWNYYNRKSRKLLKTDATDSWAYSTATTRQSNGSTANQVDYVYGVAEDAVYLHSVNIVQSSAATAVRGGIGINTTTANSADTKARVALAGASLTATVVNSHVYIPAVGYTFAAWLEEGSGSGTQTWFGDGGAPTAIQSGLTGWMNG